MKQRISVTAEEIEALLSSPQPDNFKVDTYFPLRVWLLVAACFTWFVRLTVFPKEISADLFSNPAVREFMVPALYFRAWVIVVSIAILVWFYKSSKYPAIAFGFMFVASVFNLVFDISIFYAEKLGHQDIKSTFVIASRIFFSYLLFVSMRNAHCIPIGNDRWNILLPFRK